MQGDFMLLMCKNTPIYDIDNEKILNTNLLPGLMKQKGANNHTFTKWMKYRYSSGTNTTARKLKGITFGQGARMRINRETRALSFCDCYWIKATDDPIRFEEITFFSYVSSPDMAEKAGGFVNKWTEGAKR